MNIRYLNLSVEKTERKKILERVNEVLKHGQVILGPEVRDFEEKAKLYCKVNYAIGTSSGTDALYISLRALNIGW